mgnify:CR=1 FL=1
MTGVQTCALPILTGQLTDSARHELQAVADGNATKGQQKAVFRIIRWDAGNRISAQENMVADLGGKLSVDGRSKQNATATATKKYNPATGKVE